MYSRRGGVESPGIRFRPGTAWSTVEGKGGCISKNRLPARNCLEYSRREGVHLQQYSSSQENCLMYSRRGGVESPGIRFRPGTAWSIVEGKGCISRNTLPAWNYLEYSKRGGRVHLQEYSSSQKFLGGTFLDISTLPTPPLKGRAWVDKSLNLALLLGFER